MVNLNFLFLLSIIVVFAGITVKLIKTARTKRKKTLLFQLITVAFISLLGATLPFLTFYAAGNSTETVSQPATTATELTLCFKYVSSALAIAIPAIASGIALSSTAPAAIAAISESPKISGKMLLYVALAEGILIFGLLISIMILTFA
jgi:V/A-type H+-transporting ATPase subunit K